MKILILFFIFALSMLHFACSNQGINPPEDQPDPGQNVGQVEKSVISANSEFGIPLFQKVVAADPNKNVFISPLSISIALGMALNGASGTTYEAIQQTLALNDLTGEEINQSYLNLTKLLTTLDPKVEFLIANSIWYNKIFTFNQPFLDVNQHYFNAEIAGLNFSTPAAVERINGWVAKNTKDKIKQIVKYPLDPETILYLINAIYFKGFWTYQFDPNYTRDDQFTLTDGSNQACDMMMQANYFQYHETDQFQAIDLPYGDEKFSMTIILPKGKTDPDAIINELTPKSWLQLLSQFEEKEGTIELPKFRMEYEIVLNDILTQMGMGIAFTNGADFSGIMSDQPLRISIVKHKTYVEVDEEGTEAAAVTIIGVELTSLQPNKKFYMRIDRPFLFIIRENQNETLLFMGKVVKIE